MDSREALCIEVLSNLVGVPALLVFFLTPKLSGHYQCVVVGQVCVHFGVVGSFLVWFQATSLNVRALLRTR